MNHFTQCVAWMLVGLLALPRWLAAQALDPAFHIPEIYQEASVQAAAQQANGQYVVAGSFTRVNGQVSTKLIRLSAAGTIDQTFQQNLSGVTLAIEKLYPLANGQLLVQGDYQAGVVQRRYLFRLNADGTLDPTLTLTFPGSYPYPNVEQTLVQPDGKMLVMGYLTQNTSSPELIRLLPDGSRDASFSVVIDAFSQDVQMVLQPDGKIILGGSLTKTNGITSYFFARLNSDGSTDTGYQAGAYAGARLYITTFVLDAAGGLLVGGYPINIIGGQSRSIFRLLPSGALDPNFALDASLPPRNCTRLAVQPSGKIVVLFDMYAAGNTINLVYPFSTQLCRLLPNGTLDTTFQPGSEADFALSELRSLPSGSLLTWGYIHNFSGQRRTLTLLQPDGGLDLAFAPLLQEPGSVQKILRQTDGKLLISGRFNTVDGHLTDCLARLLPSGQPDLSFAWRQPNSATWNASAVALQADGKVLLAGSTTWTNVFTSTSQSYQPFFGRLTGSGAPDAGFVPAITLSAARGSGVMLLGEQAPGQLVVGGDFLDAANKLNLTRLTAAGDVDPTFQPVSQPVIYNGLVQADAAIVCTGPLRRLLANGLPDPSFITPTPYPWVQQLCQVPGGGGYLTSDIFSVNPLSSSQVLGRVTAAGAVVGGFSAPFHPVDSPGPSYTGVNALAAQNDGRLLVGGYMQQLSAIGSPVVRLARLEANGQLDASFPTNLILPPAGTTSNFYGGGYSVNAILVQPDGALVVGGAFALAAGQAATGLVRLLPTTALAVGNAQHPTGGLLAWPVPAHDVLHLSLELAAHPQRVVLLNTIGEIIISQEVTQKEVAVNTAPLARGLYVLRVEYSDGPVTRRIVVE